MNYAVASTKPWNDKLSFRLNNRKIGNFIQISKKSEFSFDLLKSAQIDKVFVAHWSHIIPSEVYDNFEVIIFHMTDLPFGRGGSPLQNLIERGFEQTMISALRCTSVLDGGPIYIKKNLSLEGSAHEIYSRADQIIEQMIIEIISTNPQPVEQRGTIVHFDRRSPEDSRVPKNLSSRQLYNFIRMLDAPGYPLAFFQIGDTKYFLSNATYRDNELVVRITPETPSKPVI